MIFKISPFIQNKPTEVLYFSLNQETSYDFSTDHAGQSLYIALAPNAEFYQNDEKINNDNQYNVIDINEDDVFSFRKTNHDLLINYYCFFMEGLNVDDDSFISPIEKIQLKRCEDSCLECNITLAGNNDYHYCKSSLFKSENQKRNSNFKNGKRNLNFETQNKNSNLD